MLRLGNNSPLKCCLQASRLTFMQEFLSTSYASSHACLHTNLHGDKKEGCRVCHTARRHVSKISCQPAYMNTNRQYIMSDGKVAIWRAYMLADCQIYLKA